jgi:ATP-dependent helicase STH1/SNF2
VPIAFVWISLLFPHRSILTCLRFVVTSQSSLRKLAWQYIIVDEGHRMKNAQSKFAQILGTVYQSRHRILLTG